MEPESIDGYSAWISVDNVKLPQYGRKVAVTASGNKEVTCWIASEVGKEFAVNWTLPASREELSVVVKIDGRAIGTRNTHPATAGRIETKSYERVSETSVRPLVFSRRELTDDDAHLNQNTEHLGDIGVNIWISQFVRLAHAKANTLKCTNRQPPAKTHERSKKAMVSHHVALGEEYTQPMRRRVTATPIRLAISFIFKYRPQDFLQAEGIMPPTPKPDPGSLKRAAETLELSNSDDDHEEMLKRQKEQLQIRREELLKEELRVRNQESELQARLDRVESNRHRKRMKLEPQPAASLELKTEIIDLT